MCLIKALSICSSHSSNISCSYRSYKFQRGAFASPSNANFTFQWQKKACVPSEAQYIHIQHIAWGWIPLADVEMRKSNKFSIKFSFTQILAVSIRHNFNGNCCFLCAPGNHERLIKWLNRSTYHRRKNLLTFLFFF